MLVIAAVLLLFTSVCFIAGAFFKPLITADEGDNIYLSVLENLFFGLLVVVLVYASAVTKFVTILLALLPVFAYLMWYKKKTTGLMYQRPELITLIKGGFLAWVPALCFLALQAYRMDFFNPDMLQVGGGDFLHYAAVADNFHVRRTEGVHFNQFYSANNYAAGRVPYHYLDLWMNSFLRVASGLPRAEVYLYIFVPFALTVVFFSTAAVMADSWRKNKNRMILFIFALLLSFPFVIKMPPYIINANILNTPKFFLCWAFVALLIIYARRKDLVTGMLMLCMLPVVNILGSPVVFTLVFAAGCWLLWINRQQDGKHLMLLSVVTAVTIIAFYLCFSDFYVPVQAEGWTAYKPLVILATKRHSSFIQFFLDRYYLFPLVLIFVFYKINIRFIKQEYKIIAILAITYVMSVIVAVFLRQRVSDGFQSIYVPSFAILYLLFALWVGYAMAEAGKQAYRISVVCFVTLLLVCNFSNAVFIRVIRDKKHYVSKDFLRTTEAKIYEGSVIAYAYNLALRGKHPSVYHPYVCYFNLQFPGYFAKSTALVPVSLPLSFDTVTAVMHHPRSLLTKGDFAVFLNHNRLPAGSLHDHQLAFFNKFHIKYLLLDKGMDSIDFYRRISSECITDKVSGISFCILK